MAGKKTITVFGATGLQGGSVVDIFLNDTKLKNDWTVRAVTRDTTKDSAKKLQSQGAEVVSADMEDKSTLVKAMEGAAAVFAVTNYWEKMDMDLEIKQGKNMVDAAKEAGVQHFIFSSLFNITKLSGGKLPHVYHFDGKAEIADYARSTGIPASFFMPGVYMSNVPGGMMRPTPPNNNWTLTLPVAETTHIPLFDTADTGKYVKAIVVHRDQLLGKELLGSTAYVTPKEILEGFKKRFPEAGKEATFYQMPEAPYKDILKGVFGGSDRIAQEMLENLLLLEQFGYYGGQSLDASHKLVEDKLTTWDEYLKKTDMFPAELK